MGLLWVLAPAAACAQEEPPTVEALRERVEHVEAQRGHEVAADAVAHARRALASVERLVAAGDAAGARRARGIADAALVLADRLAARERARHALADARERKLAAHRRAGVAREALERAVRLRDGAGATEEPATPAAPAAEGEGD
ncbi:MAG: hypothetical protein H6719_23880 [Sandaracinaceae bacterium]|nr:hypothetical protein [Sandaracinaceae bacterium]